MKSIERKLVDRESLVSQAQTRSDQIIQNAKIDAQAIRAEADDYALESLAKLETELGRVMNQVRNGIANLQSEKEAVAAPPSDAPPSP